MLEDFIKKYYYIKIWSFFNYMVISTSCCVGLGKLLVGDNFALL